MLNVIIDTQHTSVWMFHQSSNYAQLNITVYDKSFLSKRKSARLKGWTCNTYNLYPKQMDQSTEHTLDSDMYW